MTATRTPGGVAAASPNPSVSRTASDVGFAWVIVEFAPDGILVSDDDGQIMMANRQIEELFGYDRDALVGIQVEYLLATRSRDGHGTDITAEALGRMSADGGCSAVMPTARSFPSRSARARLSRPTKGSRRLSSSGT